MLIEFRNGDNSNYGGNDVEGYGGRGEHMIADGVLVPADPGWNNSRGYYYLHLGLEC